MEAEWSLSPVIKKWGSQKGFCAQEPHRVWFGIDSSNTGFPFSHFLNHALPKCVCGGGGRKEYLDGESKREKTGIQMGGRRNWILLKLSSPAESVINLSTQNFVPFLVLRIEEHQRKGGGGGLKPSRKLQGLPEYKPPHVPTSCLTLCWVPNSRLKQCVCVCVVCVCDKVLPRMTVWLHSPPGQAWADAALFPLWITCLVGCWIS